MTGRVVTGRPNRAGWPAGLAELGEHSIATIRAGQHESGAYVACPTFANYRFGWLRDGAFCALAMSRVGERASAEAFFAWAARAVVNHRDAHYLPARFALDGALLDDDWDDRQHDGYGIWLWVMGEHQRRWGPLPSDLSEGVARTVEYLIAHGREPCYDWWEENGGHTHTATLASVAAGLGAAAEWPILPDRLRVGAAETTAEIRATILDRGVHNGHLVKWLDDSTRVDASLLAAAVPFRVFEPDHPVMAATIAEIERTLVSAGGGVHRHPDDTFYGGGEWLLLTALFGMVDAARGNTDDARRRLDWVAAHARPGGDGAGGDLPEQVRDHLLAPDRLGEWIDRWGEPACPLLWSHAMFVLLAADLEEATSLGEADPGGVDPDEAT